MSNEQKWFSDQLKYSFKKSYGAIALHNLKCNKQNI